MIEPIPFAGLVDIGEDVQDTSLGEQYEFSQRDVAEAMFLSVNTVCRAEKTAIEKFKAELEKRNITVKDLLE